MIDSYLASGMVFAVFVVIAVGLYVARAKFGLEPPQYQSYVVGVLLLVVAFLLTWSDGAWINPEDTVAASRSRRKPFIDLKPSSQPLYSSLPGGSCRRRAACSGTLSDLLGIQNLVRRTGHPLQEKAIDPGEPRFAGWIPAFAGMTPV